MSGFLFRCPVCHNEYSSVDNPGICEAIKKSADKTDLLGVCKKVLSTLQGWEINGDPEPLAELQKTLGQVIRKSEKGK